MQGDALALQGNALTLYRDAMALYRDALALYWDAIALYRDALALYRDALALQGIAKFNSLRINEMLYLAICDSNGLMKVFVIGKLGKHEGSQVGTCNFMGFLARFGIEDSNVSLGRIVVEDGWAKNHPVQTA